MPVKKLQEHRSKWRDEEKFTLRSVKSFIFWRERRQRIDLLGRKRGVKVGTVLVVVYQQTPVNRYLEKVKTYRIFTLWQTETRPDREVPWICLLSEPSISVTEGNLVSSPKEWRVIFYLNSKDSSPRERTLCWMTHKFSVEWEKNRRTPLTPSPLEPFFIWLYDQWR